MALLYERQIDIAVAGLVVSDLRITFDIERQIDPSENRGTVTIYNLAPENETRVRERGDDITIDAGYPETKARIFDGFVERVLRVREQLARKTTIKLADAVRKAGRDNARLGGITRRTIRPPVTVREVAQVLIRDIGLPVASLDPIPPVATLNDGWVFNESAASALTTLLKRVNCTWYEDDGIIRINRPMPQGQGAQVQPDAPTIKTSPDSGLIDRPIETDEGAEAVMLLNPEIRPGVRLEIESDSLNGSFKVVGCRHEGDNWHSGPFQTWVDLREI